MVQRIHGEIKFWDREILRNYGRTAEIMEEQVRRME